MDTISPTSVADMKSAIPKAATGRAAQLRAQSLAVTEGQNPEKLTIPGIGRSSPLGASLLG